VAQVPWIEAREVTRLFGATAALRGVSARFEAGTITFIRGPNGAGKSTLLAVLGTMLTPTQGSVWYERIGDDRQAIRQELGWVAHDSLCYPELTARQNVELAARLFGVAPALAWARVAPRVGAEALGERSFSTLSRGQRQRVALARALVHAPSVLLLDEPWSGLDQSSSERLERIVAEERDRGAIVVIVAHGEEWVTRLAARSLFVERGKISAG
jgi:ABC-type multidrug transport system ATPase subunit